MVGPPAAWSCCMFLAINPKVCSQINAKLEKIMEDKMCVVCSNPWLHSSKFVIIFNEIMGLL